MQATMQAMIQTKQGSADYLQLQHIDRPQPKADEVLIKVHSATVTAGDVVMRKMARLAFIPLSLMGMKYKRIPGHEFSGEVVAVGENITRFRVGDAVFGTTTGLNIGANAQYINLPEMSKSHTLAHKPENISYEQAAAIPVGAMTALYLLKKANIHAGQKILVYGASGSVGSYAVQIAKYFGADVTGVASTRNIAMLESLGVNHVIDYTQQDFTQNGQRYDVIFDAVGKTSPKATTNSLSPDGQFVTIRSMTSESSENMTLLIDMINAGQLRPFIDKRYPLEQLAEAHRYVESGRKRGNVIITIANQ